jgi:uncharacterized membrane protein YcaP (DUF421 family)
MGKQQMAQLTFFDYIVGITIGSIAATLSVQVNENTISTFTGMATWTILAIVLAFIGMHNVKLRKVIDGQATVVIQNGKILEDNLKTIRIPIDELISELRSQSVFNIVDVEFALFEPSGKLSIQKKSDKQPLTPSDMNIAVQYDGLPSNLIMDGVLQTDTLNSLNLSKAWLYGQLEKQNLHDVTDISLAQLDTKGKLYVDLKGDRPFFVIDINN